MSKNNLKLFTHEKQSAEKLSWTQVPSGYTGLVISDWTSHDILPENNGTEQIIKQDISLEVNRSCA